MSEKCQRNVRVAVYSRLMSTRLSSGSFPSPRSGSPVGVDAPVADPAFLLRVDSPLGRVEILADETAITGLSIATGGRLPHDGSPERPNPVLVEAARQLGEYFAGERHEFDLPVRLVGTEFQRQVWQRLADLRWGEDISYGELGVSTGRGTAGRAVGGAVGANPVPIIVPCHRVLAMNRRITGYSAGEGIPTKLWLLAHEGIEVA
jgi:methylated-DNA-[protein]-cysteine S-methyltransferase